MVPEDSLEAGCHSVCSRLALNSGFLSASVSAHVHVTGQMYL